MSLGSLGGASKPAGCLLDYKREGDRWAAAECMSSTVPPRRSGCTTRGREGLLLATGCYIVWQLNKGIKCCTLQIYYYRTLVKSWFSLFFYMAMNIISRTFYRDDIVQYLVLDIKNDKFPNKHQSVSGNTYICSSKN